MSLTDAALKALRPRSGTRYEVTDRDGLVIEVQPSGALVWRYRYRLNGSREKVTLGPYPTIGLKLARELRMEAEKKVLLGKSPASEKRDRQRAARANDGKPLLNFEDLAKDWVEKVLKPANKNARQDQTYLCRDILPRLGKLLPKDVTTVEVWSCIDPLLKRGHGQAARRVRSVIKRIFEYGNSKGVLIGNPATVVRPVHIAPTKSRDRTLSDEEIAQWLTAIYTSRLARPHKLALHFLLLVPVRKSELILSRWAYFDLDEGLWDIPKEIAKNGIPIRHKLPHQAVSLLKNLREMASQSVWVLPSTRRLGKVPISRTTWNTALRQLPNMPENWVIHDLRRTGRTGLSNLRVNGETAELCLNHRKGGVSGTYDRAERLEERKEALQLWANHVDLVTSGALDNMLHHKADA
ncbi:tyrosine-type recombinase/integrase [Rhodanobacter sp. BL-MT-08]